MRLPDAAVFGEGGGVHRRLQRRNRDNPLADRQKSGVEGGPRRAVNAPIVGFGGKGAAIFRQFHAGGTADPGAFEFVRDRLPAGFEGVFDHIIVAGAGQRPDHIHRSVSAAAP